MLKSLRSRLNSRGESQPEAADEPASLIAQIDELTALNRDQRSLERERMLLQLRHRAGVALLQEDRPAPSDPEREFPETDGEGLRRQPIPTSSTAPWFGAASGLMATCSCAD